MADEPISGLPSASLPLNGTELLPLVQDGETVKVSIDNFIKVTGVQGLVNGIAATVSDDSDTVHEYNILPENLDVGTNIVYTVKFQASNENVTPLNAGYRLIISIGGTSYNFTLEQPAIGDNGDNTEGEIVARFQICEIDMSTYMNGFYQISLLNPNNGSFFTYQNSQTFTGEIEVGVDDFIIESFIESTDADVTARLVSSSLTITG